ncbi:hypothetical protein [Pseudonocardia xinjiangensis]|uniref:hypothetical protein n=1 Tax=Pseudonocardia xinjiangensis TaxID=75289 RepID=UPI0031DFCEEE
MTTRPAHCLPDDRPDLQILFQDNTTVGPNCTLSSPRSVRPAPARSQRHADPRDVDAVRDGLRMAREIVDPTRRPTRGGPSSSPAPPQ